MELRIDKLLAICNEFKADTTKTGKKALLKREANNPIFKQYIKYVLDPLNTYGLQEKKIKKFLGTNHSKGIGNKDIFDIFEYLLQNPTGTDHTAHIVARFIDAHQSEEEKRFLLESFTKKMKLGISEKTVNEVWGKGFLNEFNVMLAKKFEDESHKIKGRKFVITEKYDGQRAVFFKNSNIISCYSRDGKRITGLVEIEQELLRLADGVYDGELLCWNHEELRDREVLQQTLKLTRKDGNKTGVRFFCFDYLSIDEFNDGKSKLGYLERREINPLNNKVICNEFKHACLIEILHIGNDLEVIPDMLAEMEERGKEGLMLNIADAPYECKRSDNILKLKTMLTADLRIIGFERGKPMGKFENTLGKFIVDYKGYPLGVSGISDKIREEVWNNQSNYLGAIIEVSYFRESQNEKGGLSVSFPQFKGFRWDKQEPSYN
ncbi:hypothetical protein ACIQ1D_19005 [Lysinibacillus xylanilyticus]|uniref:ATP-dependent DNA ligase n=1 Tax=Lysinibacillus xylanilyticus TaxID=582475 RepID=UPI0038239659